MPNASGTSESDVRRGDWIYGGHLFLGTSMALWRVLAATPRVAATQGGEFETSLVGRALATATVTGGVLLIAIVTWLSFLPRRELKTSALWALLVLSILWRRETDVFDLVYLALVAILGVVWFYDERPRRRAGADHTAMGS